MGKWDMSLVQIVHSASSVASATFSPHPKQKALQFLRIKIEGFTCWMGICLSSLKTPTPTSLPDVMTPLPLGIRELKHEQMILNE
jgi:hypothetical protein